MFILRYISFLTKQEMFVKHGCPPKLKCHCDLDLWPRNPKFNRSHLLVMTKHHTKLEDPWVIRSLVIDRTRFVYGPTDRPTFAKQYTPTSSKRGIKIHMSMHFLHNTLRQELPSVTNKSITYYINTLHVYTEKYNLH